MTQLKPNRGTPLVHEFDDFLDPWQVLRRLAHRPYLLALESTDTLNPRGRYSYIMADPVEVYTDFHTAATAWQSQATSAFRLPGLPPFQGGFAGLFGYGLAHEFEPSVPTRHDPFALPRVVLGHYRSLFAFDHMARRCWLISHGVTQHCREWLEAINTATTDRPLSALETIDRVAVNPLVPLLGHPGVFTDHSAAEYQRLVQRTIDYIHAGDAFQVNLSQRLLTRQTEPSLSVYERLRRCSPAPFSCYFDTGRYQVLSSSPERLLELNSTGAITTRPIKGTRPRGNTPVEDAAIVQELLTNPKDRAENVMIVDLLRNDLGRVCEYGSVEVHKVCELESFNYVHHLVSEVHGQLRVGLSPFDLLRAALPGGSVTGAPKVRAMQIIHELEVHPRGPYCGSLGMIGYDGSMDTNILIRTITAGGGWLQLPVGGGIVADSVPAAEYQETLDKAAAMLRAVRP